MHRIESGSDQRGQTGYLQQAVCRCAQPSAVLTDVNRRQRRYHACMSSRCRVASPWPPMPSLHCPPTHTARPCPGNLACSRAATEAGCCRRLASGPQAGGGTRSPWKSTAVGGACRGLRAVGGGGGGTFTTSLLSGCQNAQGTQAEQAKQRHLGLGSDGGCGGGSQGRAPLPDRRRGAHPRPSRQRGAPGGAQPRLARPGVDAADELGRAPLPQGTAQAPPSRRHGLQWFERRAATAEQERPTGQPEPPSPSLQLRSRHARRSAHRPVLATASRVALGRSGARGEAWPPP